MNKKSQGKLIFVTLLLLLIIPVVMVLSEDPPFENLIEGDLISSENNYFKAIISPHTSNELLRHCHEMNITSKLGTQDYDAMFVFSEQIKNPDIWLWKNESFTDKINTSIEKDYTCHTNNFSYTTSPNYAWCYNWSAPNQTWYTIFEHSFDSGNIPSKTITWYEDGLIEQENYKYQWVSLRDKFSYNAINDTHNYIIKDVPLQQDREYQLKWCYNTKADTNGKWDFYAKRSIDTLQEAISSGNYIQIDPWWDSGWQYKKEITITNYNETALNNYTINISVGYSATGYAVNCSSNCAQNFSDIRFANDDEDFELYYWPENISVGDRAIMWVKIPFVGASTTETIYMYYGNGAAPLKSNINQTFIFGDDFRGYADQTDLDGVNGWARIVANGDIQSDLVDGYETMSFWASQAGTDGVAHTVNGSDNYSSVVMQMHFRTLDFAGADQIMWGFDEGSYSNDNIQDGFYIYAEEPDKKIMIRSYKNSGQNTEQTLLTPGFGANEWYTSEFLWYGNILDLHILSDDGSEDMHMRDTDGAVNNYVSLKNISIYGYTGDGGAGMKIDNIHVRKYIEPVPSWTIGNEEEEVTDTAPIVNNQFPLNGSYFYGQDINFTYNVTDTEGDDIDNCTLWLQHEGGDWDKNLSDASISQTINQSLNITMNGYENITWLIGCYANNSVQGNSTAYNFSNYFQDLIAPIVNNQFPLDYTNTSSQYINFTYNVTDADSIIDTCQLFINKQNVWYNNLTNYSITKTINQSLNITIEEGNFLWKVGCNDTSGNYANSSSYNITIDYTSPIVNLQFPLNRTNTTDKTISFTYNVTDNFGVENCTLYLKKAGLWQLNHSDAIIEQVINQSLNRTLEDGRFEWKVGCWDYTSKQTNSSSYNLTIDSSAPSVSNLNFFALNSSEGIIGIDETAFNFSNIEDIEFMRVNFTLTDTLGFDKKIDIFFTANGTNPCSLGNNQSTICYNYTNSESTKWIHWRNQTSTKTFTNWGTRGDNIDCTYNQSSNGLVRSYTCIFDEHYNPNVYKHYPLNFSNITWQSGANKRIKANTTWKIKLNSTIIPLDATEYKLDFRVNYTTSDIPTQQILVYICNSSYSTGSASTASECQLVAGKLSNQLQDDGTKFRGIFTKSLVQTLGDIGFVLIESDSLGSKYYIMKTVYYPGSETIKTDISTDAGTSYTTLADGSESELNLNWFYNGTVAESNKTQFVMKIQTNDTLNNLGNSSLYTLSWIETNVKNQQPIVNIIVPNINANISRVVEINWTTAEPDGNSYTTNITLRNSTDIVYIATLLHSGFSNYSWSNSSSYNDGIYNLIIESCENITLDKFCGNDSHNIILDNTPPNITLDSPTNLTTLSGTTSADLKYTPSDNFGLKNCTLEVWSIGYNYERGNYQPTNGIQITESFISTFNYAIWYWEVNCSDYFGNTYLTPTYTFTTSPMLAPPGGGGGGGIPTILCPEGKYYNKTTGNCLLIEEETFQDITEDKISNVKEDIKEIIEETIEDIKSRKEEIAQICLIIANLVLVWMHFGKIKIRYKLRKNNV